MITLVCTSYSLKIVALKNKTRMLGLDHLLSSSASSDDDTNNSDQDFETDVFINHLRKCFVSVDDTGHCESVLLPELRVFSHNHKDSFDSLLSKRIDASSYEHVAVNKLKNQHRSLEAFSTRISELKLDEKNKPLPGYKPENGTGKPFKFEAKDRPDNFNNSVVSALTEQLRSKTNDADANSFLGYMRFEAHLQDPAQMQRIRIFLPMSGNDSISVGVFKSARVSELIGLICCKYTLAGKQPPLKYDAVENYLLKIADDTGEIEEEFSSLEASNFVGKFGFTDLALIEKEEKIGKSLKKLPVPPIKVVM